jgi:hypothetical protein
VLSLEQDEKGQSRASPKQPAKSMRTKSIRLMEQLAKTKPSPARAKKKMNRQAIIKICLAAMAIGLVIAYCARPSMRYEVYGAYSPETYMAVLKIIPIGSKIDAAKTAMETRGFRCTMAYNRRYAGDDIADLRRPQIDYPAADILVCNARSWVAGIFQKQWGVIFAVKDEVVANIAVNVGLDAF